MLHELGIKHGTDKAGHGYLPVYESYFDKYKDTAKNVLEIGVHLGASLRMWKDYFTTAQIHGIDNVPQKKELEQDRISIHIGSQDDKCFLHDVAYATPFDIIIDDGSHMWEHQIVSFEVLFKGINSGGLYAIEDLHTCYHSEFKGNSTQTTIEHMLEMIHDLNKHGYNYGNRIRTTQPNYYEQHIKAIHFHKSMVIIEKK